MAIAVSPWFKTIHLVPVGAGWCAARDMIVKGIGARDGDAIGGAVV
ncbi:hypothetical protein [Paenibacillus sinopodophylli]|nr:hypothetical protein [Paenibacillus sinopodophylli]